MEKFFKISSSIDYINIQELLLKKYDINYILELDYIEGFEIINLAYENDLKDKLWDRWLIEYRHMTKDNFIGFEEYVDRILGRNTDTTSEEELLRMAEEIENKVSLQRGE